MCVLARCHELAIEQDLLKMLISRDYRLVHQDAHMTRITEAAGLIP
jgi:hypothetical protein